LQGFGIYDPGTADKFHAVCVAMIDKREAGHQVGATGPGRPRGLSLDDKRCFAGEIRRIMAEVGQLNDLTPGAGLYFIGGLFVIGGVFVVRGGQSSTGFHRVRLIQRMQAILTTYPK
jgi:hypothetical protein